MPYGMPYPPEGHEGSGEMHPEEEESVADT